MRCSFQLHFKLTICISPYFLHGNIAQGIKKRVREDASLSMQNKANYGGQLWQWLYSSKLNSKENLCHLTDVAFIRPSLCAISK